MAAFFAVRVIVALEKRFRSQLLLAVMTNEMFGMISVAHGRHHLTHDQLVARAAMPLGRRVDALLPGFLAQLIQHRVQGDA